MINENWKKIEVLSYKSAIKLLHTGEAEFLPDSFVKDAFATHKSYKFSTPLVAERCARRVALKLANKYHNEAVSDVAFFANSLWFPIYSELCNILPIRWAAKAHQKKFIGRIILVELTSMRMAALQGWRQPCDMSPIYKYLALRKNGVVAYLVCPKINENSKLTISLDKSLFNGNFILSGTNILFKDGMRGDNVIEHRLTQNVRIKQKFATFFLKRILKFMCINSYSLTFQFKKSGFINNCVEFNSFSSVFSSEVYFDRFQEGFFRSVKNLYRKILDNVEKNKLECIHLCDHPFFIPSLFACAVKSSGGQIILWPHSASQIIALNDVALPDQINCIFKSKQTMLFEKLEVKVVQKPNLMLNFNNKYQNIDKRQKVSVVIVLGAVRLNEAYFFPLDNYTEMANRLVDGLVSRSSFVDVYFKKKGHWGPTDAYSPFVSKRIKEVLISPKELNLPNMVFVFLNHASSAILEGLIRGIPSLIVREGKIHDYLDVDEDLFPRISVQHCLDYVDCFQRRENITRLHAHQSEWKNRHVQA